MEHMPFVPTHTDTAAFASTPHLGIFDTDSPIFGDSFDEACLPIFVKLDILLLHLLSTACQYDRCIAFLLALFVPEASILSVAKS